MLNDDDFWQCKTRSIEFRDLGGLKNWQPARSGKKKNSHGQIYYKSWWISNTQQKIIQTMQKFDKRVFALL